MPAPEASTAVAWASPAASASPVAEAATPRAAETPAPASVARAIAQAIPAGGGAVVAIDPGHGGAEVGAAANGIVEKDSNLDMAQRVERLLVDAGYRVLLTRLDAGRAIDGLDGPGEPQGFSAQRRDLQARIDLANAAGAAVFVSLHSNGLNDPSADGVESYYNAARPFAAESRSLARTVQESVVTEARRAGHAVRDRGVMDDACLRAFQGVCFPLFVLGPARVTTRDEVLRRGGDPAALGFSPGQDAIASRATQMPGVLVELLFVSNPADARLLSDDGARWALARGVALGIGRYLTERSR